MKVIFLDFDGVINNWYENGVCASNVKILKQIIDKTNAKVVITSSNKYMYQLGNIDFYNSRLYQVYVKNLEKFGIMVYDMTPFVNFNRLQEINTYLKLHPKITDYLILDDDYIFEEHLAHEVFLDWYKGLQEEHIVPSINILNSNLGFYPLNFDFSETYEERLIRINEYYSKTK